MHKGTIDVPFIVSLTTAASSHKSLHPSWHPVTVSVLWNTTKGRAYNSARALSDRSRTPKSLKNRIGSKRFEHDIFRMPHKILYRNSINQSFTHSFIHSSIHCLTTRTCPLPNRVHTVRSSASCINFLHPLVYLRPSSSSLHLLPRLPVTISFPLPLLQ